MADGSVTVLWAGLGASLAFGAGDFSGGFATKRDPVTRVVALAHLLSLLMFLALALLTREAWPRSLDLLWGGLAGLSGAVGLVALYRGLALGPMGVVAATSAALSAALPVLVGAALGGRPGTVQLLGMLLALVGITLLSHSPSGGRGGLGLALIAGVGFGLFFVFLGQTQAGAVFWPLVTARVVSAGLMLALAWRGGGLRPVAALPIVLSSVFDALGNVLFVVAAQTGRGRAVQPLPGDDGAAGLRAAARTPARGPVVGVGGHPAGGATHCRATLSGRTPGKVPNSESDAAPGQIGSYGTAIRACAEYWSGMRFGN